jgi:hypothetical protein
MSFFRSNAAPKINRKCLFDVIYISSHYAMEKAYTVHHPQVGLLLLINYHMPCFNRYVDIQQNTSS